MISRIARTLETQLGTVILIDGSQRQSLSRTQSQRVACQQSFLRWLQSARDRQNCSVRRPRRRRAVESPPCRKHYQISQAVLSHFPQMRATLSAEAPRSARARLVAARSMCTRPLATTTSAGRDGGWGFPQRCSQLVHSSEALCETQHTGYQVLTVVINKGEIARL